MFNSQHHSLAQLDVKPGQPKMSRNRPSQTSTNMQRTHGIANALNRMQTYSTLARQVTINKEPGHSANKSNKKALNKSVVSKSQVKFKICK